MTEQERVLVAANALSALAFMSTHPNIMETWDEANTPVTSTSVGELTGLPLEVVEAAIKNLAVKVEAHDQAE